MAKAKKTQKNEKLPKLVKLLGSTFLAMIAYVILAPLFKEPTSVRAANQRPMARVPTDEHPDSVEPQTNAIEIAKEQLIRFLQSHPDIEVRAELTRLISTGEVYLVQGTFGGDNVAEFSLLPRRLIKDGNLPMEPALVPTLLINGEIYRWLETPAHRVAAQVVLHHEFVHYKQWRDKVFPEYAFTLQPVRSADDLQDRCTKKWHAERDAYHQGCEFARAIGATSPASGVRLPICEATEDSFDDAMRRSYEDSPLAPYCAVFWDKMS